MITENTEIRKMDIDCESLDNLPIPACVVDSEGRIAYANDLMADVFTYKGIVDSNFFALTGVKREAFFVTDDSDKAPEIKISRNDNYFVLESNKNPKENEDIIVYFINVTQRETLKQNYRDEQVCVMYISIDNYDELIQNITEDSKMAVPIEVDRTILKWAEQFDAAIESTGESTYMMSVFRKDAERIIESRFHVLDDVRNIKTKVDFPVSLSIGMGIGAETLKETTELAEAALELALGRGGDQAVVKEGDRTNYYGGTLMSFEKNNKGKSRIIAHALKQLINDSSRVIVIGHQWPDMDCFGAALGAYKISENLGKDTYLVIEEYNEALQLIFRQAKDSDNYKFINNDKAFDLCDDNTLIIVVDTNRPRMLERPELLKKAGHFVVIDHHRLSEDSLEGATLSYVESYASSACELMVEIMQYSSTRRLANKFEAEAMLAGIMVDTNSFSIKTGVRTFEAAAWLRRSGADTTEVKRFFQTEVTTFQMKAEAIANAEYWDNGVAVSVSEGYSTDIQIINSQVADQLLMVKGVKASFAIGKNNKLMTVVSARSLGEVNVQVIMERFGGGGHLSSAGAQVDLSTEAFAEELKRILPEYIKEEEEEE